jgi:leucyl-tRNA synthetase
MSVPAHAPYDWIALVESEQDIAPIQIIKVDGFGANPAKEACEQLHIDSQTETEKLGEATDLVYKKEFHTGILNEKCGSYAGIRISEIKDTVKDDLIGQNLASTMKEFSEEVICRCKEHVVIKQIPDQWFIKYSDYMLTKDSKEFVDQMNIYPIEYKDELPKILDWFDDRAVIRKGSWLGTEFPYKKDWIIEPISDSTLYPLYYIIAKFVNAGKISADEMDDAFFDYVFLGIGTTKNGVWKEIREDFDYWYPVDINLGGKEHKTVHFPVYLMNHVAIMPIHKRAQGLFVHWWVTQKGKEKISKSKGGAEPILEAATKYGVDAMRLYYAHVGSPFVDVEWDIETVTKYKQKILNLWNLMIDLAKKDHKENFTIDSWLESMLHRRIQKVSDAFDSFDLRVASNEIFYECQRDIQWYLRRGGSNRDLLQWYLDIWLRLMSPVTPHIAEELWHHFGNTTFISNEVYPVSDPQRISEKIEVGEYLLSSTTNDINEILKVTKITPKKICIYTSPEWKWKVFTKALAMAEKNQLNVGVLMKEFMADPKMKTIGKDIAQFTGKLPGEIKRLNPVDKARYQVDLDEKQHLETAKDYLEELFKCPVSFYSADHSDIYDPANKARFAIPLRPAVYIEKK